jgi:hypothetical protein
MRNALILISSILVMISPLFYVHSMLTGETQPHRTTRFVLLVITILATASLWGERGSAAFWLALISAVQCALTFVIGFRKGVGGWAPLDIACLVIAMIGVVVWRLNSQAVVVLMASIIADFVGCVPTIVKAYRLPKSEDWRFYMIDMVASVCSLLAVSAHTLLALAFPVYMILINGGVAVLALRKKVPIAATTEG